MAKGVLGNDPFQRGAASRDVEPTEQGAKATGAKKAAGTKDGEGRATAAKKAASAKNGEGRAAAKKAGGAKDGATTAAATRKSAETKNGASPAAATQKSASAKDGATTAAAARKSTDPKHEATAAASTRESAGTKGGGGSAATTRKSTGTKHGTSPAEATRKSANVKNGASPAAAKKSASAKDRKAPVSHEAPQAAEAEGPVPPLREPAAPVAPRRPTPPRKPVLPDEAGTRTPKQREVDHALAEALAAEVAEATAKVAVEDALERRPGKEEDVDRLLATELATELAEAAVEEVLEHTPATQRPERERELAATVAAQVAEAAAEVAVAEVLERRTTERSGTLGDVGTPSPEDEEDTPGFKDTFDLEADAEGGFGPDEDDAYDDDEDSYTERRGHSLSVSEAEPAEGDTSSLEPEVEVADATRDELPHGRRVPLSVVHPDPGGEPPREPFFTEQLRDSEAQRPLQERAAGMFSLAKEIAGQALASEGLGRAMGAMGGLVEAVRAGLGTGGGASLDEYGKDPELVDRLEPVLEFLYSQYWRVSVQGVDHVPGGAAILVANHSGALPYDGLVMSLALTRERPDLREPRWLVEDQVFHAPVLGTLFNRLGAVRACPENALRLLDEQRPLVVFPEGYQALSKPFSERYRLKRFGRGGFVKLALRTGAPIVPVAIVGAEETSPLLGRIPASFLGLPFVPVTPLGPLPLPAKWSIRFGEPISMDGLVPEAADDLGEVQRLTERTRESIMGMLQSLLRERRSVFAG